MASEAGQVQEGGGVGGDQAAASVTKDAAPAASWYDTYPEDIRGDLKGYDKPETLAKEFVTLKKKMAVPEKPEDYEYDDKQIAADMKQALNAWKVKAKEFGMTKEQFKLLTDYQFQTMTSLRQSQKQARDAEFQRGADELKKEWGNSFDANLTAAKKTMKQLFSASFGEFLDVSGLGNHPEMARAMVRLAAAVSEDNLIKNSPRNKAQNRDPQTGEPMLKFTSMK